MKNIISHMQPTNFAIQSMDDIAIIANADSSPEDRNWVANMYADEIAPKAMPALPAASQIVFLSIF
jgi:hypothetical protein